MRKGVAIYGATDEALALVPVLEENPDIEITVVFDPDPVAARKRIETMAPDTARRLVERLTTNRYALDGAADVHAVIDAGIEPPFAELFPSAAERGQQIVSPLTARLLWGYGVSARDRKAELLQALHEIVESVNLTIDADELFSRMLEIAMGVTEADGGSVMLLDPERRILSIRVAIGVERELWPKIRVPLGEGIAGQVAANARPMRLRGKADQQAFRVVRERFDVESALCVPLVHEGQVLGVLNLHHTTRADAFSEDDLQFAEQLGRLDAEIIARAQEHESLRSQASRYSAVRQVHETLTGKTPLLDRLGAFCRLVANRVGNGIATVYLYDADEEELRLTATSLSGGGLGGEYRITMGQGVEGGTAQTRRPSFLRNPDELLAYAALPLVAGQELVGVLSVQTGEVEVGQSSVQLGPAIEETLREIATAAAEEIAQASREARMATRTTKVSAINEAGISLISARDTSEVMRLATSSGALIMEADHAVLRLQDPQTRRYVIRSYYGSADGRLQEQLFRLDKTASVSAIKRRSPFLVRNLEGDPDYAEDACGVRSLLAAPLKRGGRVIGTLTLYDKVAPDQFYAGSFNDDDLQIFTKYVSYAERALANAIFYAQARQQRNFDEDTGLPNTQYLSRRIDQEIARSGDRAGALAVTTCTLENLEEIRRATDTIRVDRVIARAAESLQAHLRDFDVLARTGEAEFTVLLPEPGTSADEHIASLARAVADDLTKDDELNDPVRVALVFGYARFPAEGADRETLIARARLPRIQLV